jgi:hypothetical protein
VTARTGVLLGGTRKTAVRGVAIYDTVCCRFFSKTKINPMHFPDATILPVILQPIYPHTNRLYIIIGTAFNSKQIRRNKMRRISFLLVVLMCIAYGIGQGADCQGLNVCQTLKNGSTDITGKGLKGTKIKVYVGKVLYNKDDKPVTVGDDCSFKVELKKPLSRGEGVEIHQVITEKDKDGKDAQRTVKVIARVIPYGIQTPLYAGQSVIKGYLEKGLDQKIQVEISNGKTPVFRKDKGALFYDKDTGKFGVLLDKKLEKDQWVIVKLIDKENNKNNDSPYEKVRVRESPLIITPMLEGGQEIKGEIRLVEPKPVNVTLSLYWNKDRVWTHTKELSFENGDKKNWAFEKDAFRPFRDGDIVKVTIEDKETKEIIYTQEFPITRSTIDWGRVRAYFTYGLNLSREGEKLASNGSYIAFLMNTHWNLPWVKSRRNNTMVAYIDIRLHSFGETSNGLINNNNGSSPIASGASVDPGTNPDPQEPAEPSTRTANFQFGLYYPLMFSEWQYKGRTNTLFIAPIVKIGFHRFIEGIPYEEVLDLNEKHLYNWFSGGFRFGHYTKSNTLHQAHHLNSYFEIAIGRSQVTGELIEPTGIPGDPTTHYLKKSWNIYFEGRVKIPFTPFSFGIDTSANLNRGDIKDDFRIILATRVDVSSLIDKLLPRQ